MGKVRQGDRFYLRMQLNDALIKSHRANALGFLLNHPVAEEKGEYAGTLRRWLHEDRGITTHTS